VSDERQTATSLPGPFDELARQLPDAGLTPETTRDGITTVWVDREHLLPVIRGLKEEVRYPYRWFFDLTAVDERTRRNRPETNDPRREFTVVYQFISPERNEDVRLKVPLKGEYPSLPSATGVWPAADWYEREVFDMFGIRFDGHPRLKRILMPQNWEGHPLRKEHASRGTDMAPYELPDDPRAELLQLDPDQLPNPEAQGAQMMVLNLGPNHPGTHGVLRIILVLDGERIVECVPDIGFHHRGAEKMGERQTFHTFIPYTDRVDYLGGVQNNLPYVMAVERLAGIEVPQRAQIIRVLVCELYRLASHLVWLGTYGHDVGSMSPVFYAFREREKIFDIAELITGGRMHPSWFRIGGTAHDLPQGWDARIRAFLATFPDAIRELEDLLMKNAIFRRRTIGVGELTLDEALDWGVSGPNLRSCGMEWDFRKKRPYSGYEHFEFDVPTAERGDSFTRGAVRIEELRQSMRIIEQAMENMPSGDHISDDPRCMPPRKKDTMRDIETLIHHFLGVSWGHPMPVGEVCAATEAPKGYYGYYVVSDGGGCAYRMRIRTPSFAHIQIVPLLARGHTVADLLAILGSIDYVLADLDR
jgi:NADH-quinone oxidoreductase subunit C/D